MAARMEQRADDPATAWCSPRNATAMTTAVTGSSSVATTADPLGVVRSPVNSRA